MFVFRVRSVSTLLYSAARSARVGQGRYKYTPGHAQLTAGSQRVREAAAQRGSMPASTHTKDEQQFWKLVWPSLKTGGWSYEEEGAQGRSGGSDQSDEGRSTAAGGGNSRRTSSRNRKRSTSSSTSSTSTSSSNSSSSSSPAAASSPREPSAVAAGGAAAAAGTTPPKKPVFVPPVVGVASEALEEAMRRSAPADGSLEEERRSRLVGVSAVIELLQQVPGFPGTTTGIVNFDAVAAAARGVMVRTPSPPTVVENGAGAGTPAGEVSYTCWNAAKRAIIQSTLEQLLHIESLHHCCCISIRLLLVVAHTWW